jgi:hypothetical protein
MTHVVANINRNSYGNIVCHLKIDETRHKKTLIGYLSLKLHNANSVPYRTESNSIVEEIYDSYRIVREAYRYTPSQTAPR